MQRIYRVNAVGRSWRLIVIIGLISRHNRIVVHKRRIHGFCYVDINKRIFNEAIFYYY